MLRLLPWNACDKFTPPEMRMFLPQQDSSVALSSNTSVLMKRKRSPDDKANFESASSSDEHYQPTFSMNISDKASYPGNSTALKPSDGLPTPLLSPKGIKMEEPSSVTQGSEAALQQRSQARIHVMRQTVQSQLSLEILLKHKELRLIDQELAKCQTALEQLRRCTEIPFPANQLSEVVSVGKGPALRSSFSGKLPESPAPWGVTNGPYSRYYAKWLLPDARFDGGEPDTPLATVSGKTSINGRTRGSFVESGQVGVKSRSQRSGNLKALPAGYGQPKEKASGPMILKRKSDGVMVKLVCPDCGRHDFGSAQGFINHCRIGHGRNFASHDAAAEACGEAVEYDQSGAIVGAEPVSTPAASNVHPLIRSAKLLQPSPPISATVITGNDGASDNVKSLPKLRQTTSSDFRACVMTPNLSALIMNKGLGLNLQDMVLDAQTKIELPESDAEDSEMEVDTPITEVARGRHPQVAGTKQLSKPSKSPATSPLLSTRMMVPTKDNEIKPNVPPGGSVQVGPMIDPVLHAQQRTQLQPIDPSPTTESTQAPSLIDDDEDYEAYSPMSTSVSEDVEEGDLDFEVQDEDDTRQAVLPRPDFQPGCAQSAARRPSGRVRRPSALRQEISDREEKHVSFVSPSPARDMQESSPGGDRKRRKMQKS